MSQLLSSVLTTLAATSLDCVHGLRGHPWATWTNGDTLLPRNLLPAYVKNARVLICTRSAMFRELIRQFAKQLLYEQFSLFTNYYPLREVAAPYRKHFSGCILPILIVRQRD